MKRWLIPIGVFVTGAIVLGLLVMASGIIPIKASTGHWAITKRFLTFAMARSISTHSVGIEAPENLDEPALVMKGAGHFELGCAFCHGSPVWQKPRVAQQLSPTPPNLNAAASNWSPEELFYLVKHGINFTGMPAFPSQQRDDEVWSVVAFLLKLPEIEPVDYRALVSSDLSKATSTTPLAIVETCANCHGLDGTGRGTGAFPRLAGMSEPYLVATLQAYQRGARHSGIMEPIAARLNQVQIKEIASHYSQQEPFAIPKVSEPDVSGKHASQAAVVRGKRIAQEGIPEQEVGACIACHKLDRAEQNPNYPALKGQVADYLVLQLQLFQQRNRGGTEYAELMHPMSDNLKLDQMRDVAEYYASPSLQNDEDE
ncbi:c-type cytochrome [Bythopirellula goksoeyrii]|uniref:Cytochrome c-552 n=1 Tax=Bythopirellula goksoeyrii TaxID=1400387 RepID=A0A5B9Q7H1_9BACT|nr:c-type cytochrome [Bythopirellula goksoeyrii]QEG33372.1 Cytochrome c-552 precursor [Bythopirellula goksoeyrii]